MERREKAGLIGKTCASALAALVAAYVGSEMLQEVRRVKHERSLLAVLCMAVFFGIWAEWEILQVRQHLGLAEEMRDTE